jgi:hypothetical protein
MEAMKIVAVVLGVLGGIIGLLSAVAALVTVGGEAVYSSRLWAGWAALLLALMAAAAALLLPARPGMASLIMLISGVAGFACINLFYINTFYALAVPLWLAGAVVALITARTAPSSQSEA